MGKVPPDHRVFLQQRPFAFGCSTSILPVDELASLSEYGNWMEALVAGVIQPVTPEQEHFLQVEREEADPATVCERAWLRLKGRRAYEQEQAIAAPAAPPETYGIVAWDVDRCWW